MTKLWLDDERDPRDWLPKIRWMRGRPPEDFEGWVWVKTAQEAIALIETGEVTIVSLDHDLGDEGVVGNGNQVLLEIDKRSFLDEDFPIPEVHVHSSNTGRTPRRRACREACQRYRVG